MMYLRHEAGHAFNYAYELYKTPGMARPLRTFPAALPRQLPARSLLARSSCATSPAGTRRSIPDEDFAETFAVWLTPRSNWRQAVQGLGRDEEAALRGSHGRRGSATPTRSRARGATDITVDEMDSTVARLLRAALDRAARRRRASARLRSRRHLQRLEAPEEERSPGGDLLRENRKALIDKVTYWTGVQRPLVKKLVESIEARVGELDLCADIECEREHLDRSHRVRDRARDELPDPREIRAMP